MLTAANIDEAWVGTDAAALIAGATGREVTVLNDADAAGLAEVRHGAGRDISGVVLMLTLGTGIGSALFIDGTLVPNTELGHLPLKGGGRGGLRGLVRSATPRTSAGSTSRIDSSATSTSWNDCSGRTSSCSAVGCRRRPTSSCRASRRRRRWSRRSSTTTPGSSAPPWQPGAEVPATTAPPQRAARPGLTLVATGLGLFMIFLDATITNVALPSIQSDFDVGESGLQWVVAAYSLTMAMFMMTSASLSDARGRRKAYVVGIVLFSGASLAAGWRRASRSSTWRVRCRAWVPRS